MSWVDPVAREDRGNQVCPLQDHPCLLWDQDLLASLGIPELHFLQGRHLSLHCLAGRRCRVLRVFLLVPEAPGGPLVLALPPQRSHRLTGFAGLGGRGSQGVRLALGLLALLSDWASHFLVYRLHPLSDLVLSQRSAPLPDLRSRQHPPHRHWAMPLWEGHAQG